MITSVLLDLYETLVTVNKAAVERLHVDLHRILGGQTQPFRAALAKSAVQSMSGRATPHERTIEALRTVGADEALVPQIFALRDRFVQTGIELFPDTMTVLEQLKAHGLKLCVVSNVDAQFSTVISTMGLSHHFDAQILSFEVGVLKPDPAIYHKACQTLGVTPQVCAFVDDLLGNVEVAVRLGMAGYWYPRPKDNVDEVPPGVKLISSLTELLDDLVGESRTR